MNSCTPMPLAATAPAWRRRTPVIAWIVLALLPVLYIATQVASASRNFPFWDEVDSAIDFLLKLQSSGNWHQVLQQFFAVSNEHRTVTSRVIFALSYALTGTVNFHVIGAIGNLFIVGGCLLLIFAARTVAQRVRAAVVIGLLVFQLENFENFIWSGASIDHFQIIFLAVAAFVGITRNTRAGLIVAAVAAILATFTLAHGCVVWPVAAVWLWQRRAWRELTAWSILGVATITAFLAGFTFNPGHNVPDLSFSALVSIAVFWLELLGAPLTLGIRSIAAWPGLVLLGILGVLAWRGSLRRHPAWFLTALFGAGALVLVAFGRVNVTTDMITSRYLILSTTAWAMAICLLLEDASSAAQPFRWLIWLTPALAGLNVSADIYYQKPKEAFIEVRDRAATYFKQYGHTGEGISRMHPQPQHADAILAAAYAKGVYHLSRVSESVDFPVVQPNDSMVAKVDELIVNDRAVTIGGWAMLPGKTSRRGQVYVILEAENAFLVFSTLTLQRPDVARAYHEPRWRLSGYRAVIGRTRLPMRTFRVGLLIYNDGKAEYHFTGDRLVLSPGDKPPVPLASPVAVAAGSGSAH